MGIRNAERDIQADISEKELIQKIQRASQTKNEALRDAAFSELYSRLDRGVRQTICYAFQHAAPADVEDISQKTWEIVSQKINTYKISDKPIAHWINKIAWLLTKTHLRKLAKSSGRLSSKAIEEYTLASDMPSPEETLVYKEKDKTWRFLIRQLSEIQRSVLEGWLSGLSVQEQAVLLKTSAANIYQLRSRSRKCLRQMYTRLSNFSGFIVHLGSTTITKIGNCCSRLVTPIAQVASAFIIIIYVNNALHASSNLPSSPTSPSITVVSLGRSSLSTNFVTPARTLPAPVIKTFFSPIVVAYSPTPHAHRAALATLTPTPILMKQPPSISLPLPPSVAATTAEPDIENTPLLPTQTPSLAIPPTVMHTTSTPTHTTTPYQSSAPLPLPTATPTQTSTPAPLPTRTPITYITLTPISSTAIPSQTATSTPRDMATPLPPSTVTMTPVNTGTAVSPSLTPSPTTATPGHSPTAPPSTTSPTPLPTTTPVPTSTAAPSVTPLPSAFPPQLICLSSNKTNSILIQFDGRPIEANKSRARAKAGPFHVELLPGSYRVTLVSHDAHLEFPYAAEQEKEQWYIVLQNEQGENLGMTDSISDLPSYRDWFSETVDENLQITQTVTFVTAKHSAYPSENSNSVIPACALFELVNKGVDQ